MTEQSMNGTHVHTNGSHVHTNDSHVHTNDSHVHTNDSHVHTNGSHVHTNGSHAHTKGSHDDERMEPIAIIGVAGRWPGAPNFSSFCDMLLEGRTGQADIDDIYYNIDGFYHPNRERPGSINMKKGYMLSEDSRKFDNNFFGITPTETRSMDPQQRQLLEVAYECFESAGVTLERLSSTRTGCFVGSYGFDYAVQRFQDTDYTTCSPYGTTGSINTLLSNRISYVFNLKGPSLTLDTACSSSLYALDIACKMLSTGSCSAALVAGVNLIVGPYTQLDVTKLGVSSQSSTCHSFDATADGYARAEGCGAIYVKLLKDALKDNDPIRAVVAGIAVNSNGKTSGITHPSPESQESVIKEAYMKAGIDDYSQTGFFECHATGTPTGDPLEVNAIGRVFSPYISKTKPLLIGSVKSNLGHSEAASGIASLLKAIMILENKTIPPTIGIETLNPNINFQADALKVVTKQTPLPAKGGVLRVSVNNFGFGGANAHTVLDSFENNTYNGREPQKEEQATELEQRKKERRVHIKRKFFLLPFSATCEASLQEIIRCYEARAATYNLPDLAYTLGVKRSHFFNRAFTLAGDCGAENRLWEVTLGRPSKQKERIGFVFTGQGAQWAQMGLALMDEFPEFMLSVRELDGYLSELTPRPVWSIEDILRDPEVIGNVPESCLSQTLCTALQVSLVNILSLWNIKPEVIVGHSSGEIAAAYCAGLVTAREAITIAYFRGLSVSRVNVNGSMLAVGLSAESIAQYLRPGITIGCYNSPESVTLTGDETVIKEVYDLLVKEKKVFARLLRTGGKAYHSVHMKEIGSDYQSLLEQTLKLDPTSVLRDVTNINFPMISSVHPGEVLSNLTRSYWKENLESPVYFASALESAINDYHLTRLIEIGPHGALEGPIRDILKGLGVSETVTYMKTMHRGERSATRLLNLAGELYINGVALDLGKVNLATSLAEDGIIQIPRLRTLTDLPGYIWDHSQLFWDEARVSHEYKSRRRIRHDILGSRLPYDGGMQYSWRNILRPKDIPWLNQHKKHGKSLFPAAGYLALALEALQQIQEESLKNSESREEAKIYTFKDVAFLKPLPIDDVGCEITFTMRSRHITPFKSSGRWFDFAVMSTDPRPNKGNDWTENCIGSISVDRNNCPVAEMRYEEMSTENTKLKTETSYTLSLDELYRRFEEKASTFYGPEFRRFDDIVWHQASDKLSGRVKFYPPTFDKGENYLVHPTTLDSAIQLTVVAAVKADLGKIEHQVPSFIDTLSTSITSPCSCRAVIQCSASFVGLKGIRSTWEMCCPHSRIKCKGMKFMHYPNSVAYKEIHRYPYLRLQWRPDIIKLDKRTLQIVIDQHYFSSGPNIIFRSCDMELGLLIDLHAHKFPNLKVLVIEGFEYTNLTVGVLGATSEFKRYKSLDFATIHPTTQGWKIPTELNGYDQPLSLLQELENNIFDLVIIPDGKSFDGSRNLESFRNFLYHQISRDARVILPYQNASFLTHLDTGNISNLDADYYSILTRSKELARVDNEKTISLIHAGTQKEGNRPLVQALVKELNIRGWTVSHTGLEAISQSAKPGTKAISVADLEGDPVMENLDEKALAGIQRLVSCATTLWITRGDISGAANPSTGLLYGLMRSVMAEEPHLQFDLVDLCLRDKLTLETYAQMLCQHAEELFEETALVRSSRPDREFVLKDGIFHVSRYVPDTEENQRYNVNDSGNPIPKSIKEASFRAKIREVSNPDSLCFCAQATLPLEPDDVEFRVTAATINAKGVMIMMGLFEPEVANYDEPYYLSLEHAGVVERVGSSVKNIAIGDLILSSSQGNYGTVERAPAFTCQKLVPGEDPKALVTMPVPYMTAIYALDHLAQLKEKEIVLIHSAAGPVGIAAIRISMLAGAQVYVTVSSDKKRLFLQEYFGLSNDRIFHSRDRSFVKDIMNATKGKGVDVVLSAQTGDLLHETLSCLASFGRYIDIARRDSLDHGYLNMEIFARHASFFSFDLEYIKRHKPELFTSLFADVMRRYRASLITPITPVQTFDVSQLSTALRVYMQQKHAGRIVIDYTNKESRVMCLPSKDQGIKLRPDASYLLVGGLGGLGRSLVTWMLQRGAKHFIFLSRQGCSTTALPILDVIERWGGTAMIVKGDVSRRDDCLRALQAGKKPLKGVVHAAMVLRDGLFSQATVADLRTVILPKHQGAWNLHELLANYDLDFFLLMSSISAAVGPMVQYNYAAANASLDCLARLRNSMGLPAASVALGAISEVGYLSEHEDVMQAILRLGTIPMSEAEYLSAIELGIRDQLKNSGRGIPQVSGGTPRPSTSISSLPKDTSGKFSYLLTGLELSQLRALHKTKSDLNLAFQLDPRFSLIVNNISRSSPEVERTGNEKDTETSLYEKVASIEDAKARKSRLREILLEKTAQVLMKPEEQIDCEKPLGGYGMDSLVGGELRVWLYQEFRVDISFMELSEPSCCIEKLLEMTLQRGAL